MQAFVKVVERFNLQRKVMSITGDSGSNVLKLAMDFEAYSKQRSNAWRPFNALEQHVPCLVHVINLAVQAMFGKDGLGAEAPSDAEFMDVEDDDDMDGSIRTSIVKEEEGEEDAESVNNNSSTRLALLKLRKGIFSI
ncbi:hypothetical protein BKA57DRAFT_497559, partial [Linnemannia elongata]